MSRALAEEDRVMAILEAQALHGGPGLVSEAEDDDEPQELMCTCRKPAYGDMIACENDKVECL
jgi:hypothetical protein